VIIFRPDRYRQPAAGTRTALPGPAPGLASGKEIHATCQTAAALRKWGWNKLSGNGSRRLRCWWITRAALAGWLAGCWCRWPLPLKRGRCASAPAVSGGHVVLL